MGYHPLWYIENTFLNWELGGVFFRDKSLGWKNFCMRLEFAKVESPDECNCRNHER